MRISLAQQIEQAADALDEAQRNRAKRPESEARFRVARAQAVLRTLQWVIQHRDAIRTAVGEPDERQRS